MVSTSTSQPSTAIWRRIVGPDLRDLLLLVVGVVLGIVAGPAVLGRVAPDTYHRLFTGAVAEYEALREFQDQRQAARQRVLSLNADTVLENFDMQTRMEQRPLEAALDDALRGHREVHQGRMNALLLALVGVMVVESLLVSRSGNLVDAMRYGARLASARYALAAGWLAMLLAVPAVMRPISVVFVLGLLIAVLAVGMAPLEKTAASDDPGD